MKLATILLLAGMAVTVGAQAQDFPFKPLPTVRVQLTDRVTKWYEPLPVRRKTADAAWWEWFAASNALTIADTENSVYALKKPGASEANFLFGAHPGRARYYAVMAPITAACDYLSWKYKREDDALKDAGIQGHKFSKWWLVQAVNTGAHAVGILVTLGSTGR
jgi:hypothetical protein